MPTCFDNIVSFRGKCDATAPTSGLYTDQIGLHRKEVEQYFSTPYQSAEQFFDDQLNMSITEVQNSVYTAFLPRYRSTSIIDNSRIGHTVENLLTKTGSANKYRGIEVVVYSHLSAVDFHLSEFSLFIDTTATVTIKVYDLNQGLQIDSFTVSAVANQISTYYPAKTYTANRQKLNLAFVYDTSLYDSYQTQIIETGCSSCRSNAPYHSINNYISARAIEVSGSDSFVPENITNIDHTAGIRLVYSLNCNHKEWLCSASNLLAVCLLYKTAFNIVQYGLNATDRENHRTISQGEREKMKERCEYYDYKFRETLKQVLNNMQPPKDGICYICNNRVKSVVSLP